MALLLGVVRGQATAAPRLGLESVQVYPDQSRHHVEREWVEGLVGLAREGAAEEELSVHIQVEITAFDSTTNQYTLAVFGDPKSAAQGDLSRTSFDAFAPDFASQLAAAQLAASPRISMTELTAQVAAYNHTELQAACRKAGVGPLNAKHADLRAKLIQNLISKAGLSV